MCMLLLCLINVLQSGAVEYTLSTSQPGDSSDVSVTITSKPVEQEAPINIDAKSDVQSVQFNEQTQVGEYFMERPCAHTVFLLYIGSDLMH